LGKKEVLSKKKKKLPARRKFICSRGRGRGAALNLLGV